MIRGAWRLPWTARTVPHGLLDILRGCNLTCRACYNTAPAQPKRLELLRDEFNLLARLRKLDSVSIVGGEPTLHPQLCDVVRMIKSAGVSVELFTNGLHTPPEFLAQLKAAGTDLVFLHIDAHQSRPDLPRPDGASLRSLWASKAAAVAAAGMEVGLAITAYPDAESDIDAAVDFVISSPHADYLLVTLFRDTGQLGPLSGSIAAGIHGRPAAAGQVGQPRQWTNKVVYHRLKDRFGLLPFAYLGDSKGNADPRWLSYLIGAVVAEQSKTFWRGLRPSCIERFFVRLYRLLRGRYPFYIPQSPGRFRVQLLLNALSGGLVRDNLGLVRRSLRRGDILRAKRLLFQCPAYIDGGGSLVHCENCPDATIRGGTLVPVCVSDQLICDFSRHPSTPDRP
ncbi:MAG: radical SAM protein [Planctomycetota bacterium]|nr:radical SAM protein [Planctomycetota bacterium]